MGQLSLRDQKQLADLRAMREVGFHPIMQCQRCINGQVLRFSDGRLTCSNCGADHTPDGKLIEPIVATGVNTRNIPHWY